MAPKLAWFGAGALALACALPKVELDPSLTPGAGGNGGSGGLKMSDVPEGTGGLTGSGGSSFDPGGQAGGASDDPRELACGDYCTTYIQNCSNSPANTYTGLDDCLNTCFTSDWPFGTDQGEPNSIQCRDLHAHLARDLPDPHCYHSAKVPSKTTCALPTP